MTRRSSIIESTGPLAERHRRAYGADRPGEPGSRVGVTKPTRAARKARRRRGR